MSRSDSQSESIEASFFRRLGPPKAPKEVLGRAEASVALMTMESSALATRLPTATQSGIDHCDRGAERAVSPCDPIAERDMTFEMFLIKYCVFSLQNLCIGNVVSSRTPTRFASHLEHTSARLCEQQGFAA